MSTSIQLKLIFNWHNYMKAQIYSPKAKATEAEKAMD